MGMRTLAFAGCLLAAAALSAADKAGPEVAARKTFDKAAAGAKAAYQAALVRAYKSLDAKLQPLIAAARKPIPKSGSSPWTISPDRTATWMSYRLFAPAPAMIGAESKNE